MKPQPRSFGGRAAPPNRIIGLPGVREDRLWAAVCDSVSGLIAALQWHHCVQASGSFGGITVYRDDNRCYRCLFHETGNCIPASSEIFAHRVQIRDWLKAWMPKLHTAPKRRAA